MNKKYKPLLISLGILIFWIYTWIGSTFTTKVELEGVDFFSYYLGAYLVRTGKVKDIYSIKVQTSFKNKLLSVKNDRLPPYRSTISGSAFYYPFSFLKPEISYAAFFLVQIFSLSICCFLLIRYFNANAVFTVLFSLSPPVVGALLQGQQSILLTMFCLLSILLFNKQKYFLAGLLLSTVLVKLQFLPIVFFIFIIIKNKNFIYGLIGSGLVNLFINFLIYGGSFVKDYLSFLTETESPYYGSHKGISYTLQVLLETVDSLLKTNTSELLVPVSVVAILSIGLVLYFKRNVLDTTYVEKLGLAILLGIPLGAHVYFYDLVMLIIPFCVLLGQTNSKVTVRWRALFLLLFIVFTIFNFWVVPMLTLAGLLIIFASTYFYIRKSNGTYYKAG